MCSRPAGHTAYSNEVTSTFTTRFDNSSLLKNGNLKKVGGAPEYYVGDT